MLTFSFVTGVHSHTNVHIYVSFTSACWVHSNVYCLGNIHCIRYFTTVDSILKTSSKLHLYHHMTSSSMKLPLCTTVRNSGSIGEVPVPYGSPCDILSMRMLVSYAEQGIIILTNVIYSHKAIVLVCCSTEREPDTCNSGKEYLKLSIQSLWRKILWRPNCNTVILNQLNQAVSHASK